MNQYERANAVHKVEGYDLRLEPRSRREDEFEAAKAACLRYLREQLAHVESLTFQQYIAERKERSRAA